MKAEELRIGNYVNDPTWGTMVVESILGGTLRAYLHTPDKEYLADFPLSEIQPIPLTEEWLVKFGFELVHKGNKHWNIQDPNGYKDLYKIHVFSTMNNKWQIAFSDMVSGKDITYCPAAKIEYVHQLQNLYFALTGEELTIK